MFARHERWAAGVRAAVEAWGLPIQCADPARHSPVLTGVMMPAGVDADAVRRLIYERFDLSLGTGLGKVKGRMFRIGHLGDSNDLTLLGALAGCEMGLKLAGVRSRGERRAGGDGPLRPTRPGRRAGPGRLTRPSPARLFAAMSLPHFIHESLDDILAEWERHAGAGAAEPAARRQHFGKVLRAVADEMKRAAASTPGATTKAAAAPAAPSADGAPHSHASQLVGDYASLRTSVVRQWRQKHPSPSASDLDDLVRFNEAMDRSLAELTATFSPSESQPQALFLGVLNHELRTSVASILMSAQVLTHRSTPGSPEGKAAQRILRSCEQVRQSLDALSDFTKVRLGEHLEIQRERADLGVLCRQAVDAFARIDPERRIRLTSEGDLHGDWDGQRIRDAIGGLIGNASRFASRGSHGDDRGRRPGCRRDHDHRARRRHADRRRHAADDLRSGRARRVRQRDLRRARPRPLHRAQGHRRARRPGPGRGRARDRHDVHRRAAAPGLRACRTALASGARQRPTKSGLRLARNAA